MGELIKYCDVCGKQFVPYRSYQRFCSNKCREIMYEKKYRYRPTQTKKVKCLHCGGEFETNDAKKKYCSKECYTSHQLNYHPTMNPSERTCMYCGEKFSSTHAAKKYCSNICYLAAKRKRETRDGE